MINDIDTTVSDLALYRAINRRSRAIAPWTYRGSSGCVRRATCIFCRRVIATCSANWPTTKQFRAACETHSYRSCADSFFSTVTGEELDIADAVLGPLGMMALYERMRIASLRRHEFDF